MIYCFGKNTSHTPGSDYWRRGKETSFSIYTTLVAMCCTIVYEWTGGRNLVVIHHCVEWFNPHRINVSIQHNPLRPLVGDVCLLSHQWWKQTWKTHRLKHVRLQSIHCVYMFCDAEQCFVVILWFSFKNQPCLPSFHSRVAGWMKPNNSSLSTAFGFRSLHTGFFFKFTYVLWRTFNICEGENKTITQMFDFQHPRNSHENSLTLLFPVPAFPITNTEWRMESSSSNCTTWADKTLR